MTPLNKTVRRCSRHEYRCYGNNRRRIIVSLEPGDIIRLRWNGLRHPGFTLPIEVAMREAQIAAANRNVMTANVMTAGGVS